MVRSSLHLECLQATQGSVQPGQVYRTTPLRFAEITQNSVHAQAIQEWHLWAREKKTQYADLGNLSTWCCQHNTCADNLHHFSSRTTKGLQLSKRSLVKRVQGSLGLLDDRLCSCQLPTTLFRKSCYLRLHKHNFTLIKGMEDTTALWSIIHTH